MASIFLELVETLLVVGLLLVEVSLTILLLQWLEPENWRSQSESGHSQMSEYWQVVQELKPEQECMLLHTTTGSSCLTNCARAYPSDQEQIVESIQVIPREFFPERIEEQTVDILVRPIVKGSFPSVDESASPVYNQVHQEQIAAEQESFERVQQHTVEQIIHVPIPHVQEQIAESIQVIPR